MNKSILVIAAHADDEALGCGGMIARHVAEGDNVSLILMADGVHSRPGASRVDLDRRVAAAEKAHSILGIKIVHMLGFPDNRMDSVPLLEIVQVLEPLIKSIAPSIVYSHYHGDLNIDHRRTYEAVMTACRPQPGSSVKEIYGFEVLSSTEWGLQPSGSFSPSLYVDISDLLAIKIRALEAYSEEMRQVPHTRSIDHAKYLAWHRGYSVGVAAAEAFVVYRIIQ